MRSSRPPAASQASSTDLSLHFIGDAGLLLDRERGRLYALNTTATLIWCMLQDGMTPAGICRSLTEQLAVPADEAAAFVADALRQIDMARRTGNLSPDPAVPAAHASAHHRSRRRHAASIATYALLGTFVRIHYHGARLFDAIHPLLEHCAVVEAVSTDAVEVAVVPDGDGVAIIVDDVVRGSSWTIDDAAVAVRACLTELATSRSGGLCIVHAGALCRDGQALLLPGDAGFGKSTLSAGLAARGFDMLCDDTTLLAGEPPLVRCIPNGLCIKRGAYPVLEPLYPSLGALPEWRRPDGKHARYLMPATDVSWAAPDSVVGVRRMVFPLYHPGRGTALRPLARHEALARLLPGVCFLSGTLDDRNLGKLIDWIEHIDCFDLSLSSLDDATALIDELCR